MARPGVGVQEKAVSTSGLKCPSHANRWDLAFLECTVCTCPPVGLRPLRPDTTCGRQGLAVDWGQGLPCHHGTLHTGGS